MKRYRFNIRRSDLAAIHKRKELNLKFDLSGKVLTSTNIAINSSGRDASIFIHFLGTPSKCDHCQQDMEVCELQTYSTDEEALAEFRELNSIMQKGKGSNV